MKIGLWSDCHNFPSLPAMKLSAYHKSIGDEVELFDRWNHYDLVYASKVFSWTDDYFDKAQFVNSDSQLYKQAGNGVTVAVVEEIGRAIAEVEKMTLEEAANGLLFLNKAIEDHEKLDEEIKLKDSIHFLKEYCDKHEYCEGCYIRRKAMLNDNDVMFQHGSCLFKTVINFCEDKL